MICFDLCLQYYNPELLLLRRDFIEAIQHDVEAAEALSHVTADIVAGWQG